MVHGNDIAEAALHYEQKHGGHHITYGTGPGQLVCNQFVVDVLRDVCPGFPYVLANDFYGTGYFTKIEGAHATPQRGDLVHWHDHVGIVLNGDLGEFIGSQSSTGVAVSNFKHGYWHGEYGGKTPDYFLRWSHH
jgi:hypothetical protein